MFIGGVKGIVLGLLLAPWQFEGPWGTLCIWLQIQVELDLKYQPPEGATGAWAEEGFGAPTRDR